MERITVKEVVLATWPPELRQIIKLLAKARKAVLEAPIFPNNPLITLLNFRNVITYCLVTLAEAQKRLVDLENPQHQKTTGIDLPPIIWPTLVRMLQAASGLYPARDGRDLQLYDPLSLQTYLPFTIAGSIEEFNQAKQKAITAIKELKEEGCHERGP